MSDLDLRELERRFRILSTVEAEANWLRARVQAGELEQSLLELAAYLGHPAARSATQLDTLDPREILAALRAEDVGTAEERMATFRARHRARGQTGAWVSGLRVFGAEACARAALAMARVLERQLARAPDPDSMRSTISLVERWIEAPSPELAAKCRARAVAIEPVAHPVGFAQHTLKGLALMASQPEPRRQVRWALWTTRRAICTPEEKLEAIRNALLPWVLGQLG